MHSHPNHQLDPQARRVYGPLWLVMIDVWSLMPKTDPVGLMTLVALCSETEPHEVTKFAGRLSRPMPGRGVTANRWIAHHLQPATGANAAFKVDERLLTWVGNDPARRLWAVVAVNWGIPADTVIVAYDELLSIGARPRQLGVPAVTMLAAASARQIPRLLVRKRGLDVVCAEFAADTGVTGAAIDVVLPAALSAVAAALANDPTEGVAAIALLVQSRVTAGIDPDVLEGCARQGSSAAALAEILSRLWRVTRTGGAEHETAS